jgi:hypothetical protein
LSTAFESLSDMCKDGGSKKAEDKGDNKEDDTPAKGVPGNASTNAL